VARIQDPDAHIIRRHREVDIRGTPVHPAPTVTCNIFQQRPVPAEPTSSRDGSIVPERDPRTHLEVSGRHVQRSARRTRVDTDLVRSRIDEEMRGSHEEVSHHPVNVRVAHLLLTKK